jgi:hypothetical protein
MRFRKILGDTLEAVLQDQKTDSPVYTFLHQLTPPALGGQAAQAVAQAGRSLEQAGQAIAEAATNMRTPTPGAKDPTLAMLIEQGEQAIKQDRFADAKALFGAALHLSTSGPESVLLQHNPYLIQRLVLATYKAKQPDELSALQEAMERLAPLDPEDSNDPETVGLAGAIKKRFFDKGQGAEHLDRAIWYYGRGYYLRNDWYNGINLAYLLNVRPDTPLDATPEEQVADLVWANRLRRAVLALCERELQAIRAREGRLGAKPDQLKAEQQARDGEQQFWCLATKAEAHFGLGELDAYEQTRAEAQAIDHADWMMVTFDAQIGRLRALLEKHGHLLNPPWSGGATVGPTTA